MPKSAVEVQPHDDDPKAVIPDQGELTASESPNTEEVEDSGEESPMEEEEAPVRANPPQIRMMDVERVLEVN